MMIRAVLFDLDGVLVDAREWHYEALNKALSLFGYTISRDEHDGFYNGLPTSQKLIRLSEDKGLPVALHGFLSEMKQVYTREFIHQHTRPRFSHQLVLQRLQKKGISLGVCSNAIKDTIDLMLQLSSVAPYFQLILSNQDVAKNKPDPEIYLKAMHILEVAPHETLIVEDSPHGIAAAQASGAHVLMVESAAGVHVEAFKQFIPDIY